MKRPTLYDQYGRPVRMRAMVPYDAAGSGRRARNWQPGGDSINTIVFGYGDELRRRSRDQVRRNAYAATACNRYVSNIVGTGIVPVSQAKQKKLRTQVKDAWSRWVDEADADGRCDFYGLQRLAVRQAFEAGECFARLRARLPQDGLSVPMQVQLLEPDFLRDRMNEDLGGGRRIRQGIEFDALGRRAAFHFYREHPGERYSFAGLQTTRVPASEVIQLFEPERPGQLRGLPKLSTVLARLYEIDQWDDATMAKQRLAALFAFFFTRASEGGYGEDDDADDPSARIASLEPGAGYELAPGEDVKFSSPPDAGPYMEVMRQQLRYVASGADVTYEQLTGDLTGVNYSSIRAGLLEIRRAHEMYQHGVVCFQFNRPIWSRWFADAVLVEAIGSPADFSRRPWLYTRTKWVPQGWQWVDPEKEIKAVVLAIRAGLMTRSQAVAQYGYDAEEIDLEMAADNDRADALGLSYESDGRRATNQQPAGPSTPEPGSAEGDAMADGGSHAAAA